VAVVALEEGHLRGDSQDAAEGIHVDLVRLSSLIPTDDRPLASRGLVEIDNEIASPLQGRTNGGLAGPRRPREGDVHDVAESRPR
jgi:hypothetical protein